MERNITLDPANVMGIYGHNNSNIDLLRNIYPKVKIIARGNEVKVMGEDSEVELFLSRFELLLKHFEQFGKINENDILNITAAEDDSFYRMDSSGIVDNIILHGREGRVIKAITPNQRKMVASAATNRPMPRLPKMPS